MKRRILAKAARDLANIEKYVSGDSPEAAAAIAVRLRKSFDLITARPEIGRPSEVPKIREWSVPGLPYMIPYRVRGDVVEILRVFHTSQQRPARWIGE
jgi:toxin ParE1/3/4